MAKNAEIAPAFDLRAAMRDGLPEEDPQAVAEAIVDQILTATEDDEIFGITGGTKGTKEMVNVPLELRDVAFRNTQIVEKDGTVKQGVYALLDAIELESGELVILNTSSPRIMAQALRLKELERLPKKVVVTEVAVAKPGQSAPLGLQPIAA